jgi:hypothetical protein
VPVISSRYESSGPILDFWVGVSEPRRRLLESKGLPVPPALRLPFIIDTGADTTMVNDQHMRTLGIPPRGRRDIVTSSTEAGTPSWCETYDISLMLVRGGDDPFVIPALEAFGRPLYGGSIEGMIGRDVLSRLTLVVEGRSNRFRLEY